ncbi:thioredoxin H4-1-like isoform X1 [Macadamia integrifolia]|uniref:thioredoxin H4-1-like isoform X1 n=1 Tax=Macadamia integrifolia TaxID=60698 RepID=UPI001C5298FB|nr:thioredoxin H4-1-like isoform X1 [Macadamia integrifolia]XP_042476532.1 thioredoxin H4-1-like isoform X1 [Macadamia integrifolia]XP_042476533.1 thioredoxin H4-1-like isoform X1 [Macadamia integrifolia]
MGPDFLSVLVLNLLTPSAMWMHFKDENDADPTVNFASGNIHLITTKEKWDEKISEANNDSKFVVVNFSASWCGPCRLIAPFYSELSEKYPSLMFLTVDVDELTEFSSSWDIRATPTFFVLKDGQQVDKLVGANKPELLKKIIDIADTVAQVSK